MQEKAEALAREKEDERDEARREIHELEARICPSPPLTSCQLALTHALSRSSLALEQVCEGRGGAREEERGAGARV